MSVGIVLPTVTGREDGLRQAYSSYMKYTPDVKIIVLKDRPVCGEAWLEGAARLPTDYIWFGADDVDVHPGWWERSVELLDLGYIPAPRILHTDGTLQSCGEWGVEMPDGSIPIFTRSPMVTRRMWESFLCLKGFEEFMRDAHYFTDNAVSWAGRKYGYETVVNRKFLLTHHLSDVRRGAGSTWEERMRIDHEKFIGLTGGGR